MINKIFSNFWLKINKSPLYGRSILVLFFLTILIKQFFLFFLKYHEMIGNNLLKTISNYLSYFASDFLVMLIVFAIVLINIVIINRKIKIFNNFVILIIYIIFLIDVFIIFFFQSRISIVESTNFGGSSANDFSGIILIISTIVIVFGIISFLVSQNINFKKHQKLLLSLVFFLFSFSCFFISLNGKGLDIIPENIFYMNINRLNLNNHNEIENILDNKSNIETKYEDFFVETQGLGKKVNIIVLFAESFSAIDSLKIGGVKNNLPYFDRIQEDGISFNDFLANGDVSFLSHISFLLGIEPLKLMSIQKNPYSGYQNFLEPLAHFFNNNGYDTTFISSVSLGFLNQREFIENVGFQSIIGEEYFDKEKKYVFGAAPDEKLYQKTLETIKNKTDPYMVVLQNISFHKPYDTPYGKDQESAIKYADEKLFDFYEELKSEKFFENGVLVIMSDHRKMEPLEESEKNALGESWRARAVATIVGTGIKPNSINNNIIQHTDFFYGLRSLVASGKILTNKFANDIFGNNKSRDRGLMFAPYSQNRKYNIISKQKELNKRENIAFSRFSEIENIYPEAYKYLLAHSIFQYNEKDNVKEKDDIIVIAHRGSPYEATENSIEGFVLSKKNGADGVEFDVSYTKDNKNIVMHGEKLYSTICKKNNVREKNLERIQTNCPLSNGETIKTLESLLKNIDGLFDYYFLEIKVWNKKYAKEQTLDAINTVKKLGMQNRVIFISYDDTARYILGSHKDIIAGWDTFDINDGNFIDDLSHKYFLLPYSTLLQHSGHNLLENIEKIDKTFVTYTVNDTGSLQQLYDKGVRVIMTDDVPMIKEWWKNKENK